MDAITAANIREMEARMLDMPIVGLALDVAMRTPVEAHSHARGQLMYCSSGVMIIQSEGTSWVAPPNRAVWMPAGVTHTFFPQTRVQLRNLLVLPGVEGALPKERCFVEVSPLLRELIVKAVTGLDSCRSDAHRGRLLQLIIDELQPSQAAPLRLPEPADPRIRRICEHIKAEPADPRTLEDWSTTAGASSRTLARLFLRETGLSFSNWRRQARLIHATMLLGLGHSVTSAALESGYESPSAFIEMFRRSVGETPGQYYN